MQFRLQFRQEMTSFGSDVSAALLIECAQDKLDQDKLDVIDVGAYRDDGKNLATKYVVIAQVLQEMHNVCYAYTPSWRLYLYPYTKTTCRFPEQDKEYFYS